MNRIGIARVSTKNQQASGHSLTEQVQRLKQYDSTMPILQFAQSAYNKSIFPLISEHLTQNIEIVVLYCDRLSRKMEHCTDFITKKLNPINGHIYSIADNIRTNTKTGLFEFYKKIMDGETLSHNLGLRVKDGLKYRKKTILYKYGTNQYEKNNIKIIIDLYHSKTKIKNILNYLNENNIKRCENDKKNTWSCNKINIIIKENKNKKEYKNNFSFDYFKKELNNIQGKKRKNTVLVNPKNKIKKTEPEINSEPDGEYECFVNCELDDDNNMDIDMN